MDLRQLRYFVTVADERHFTRAAARLGISQPPLTQQIQALELEMGLKLFVRSTRRVELTEPGRVFATEARAILARLPQAVALAQRTERGLAGKVRVGFTESASFNPLVIDSLRAFRAAFPEIELEIEENVSTRMAAALEAGELDAAFLRPPLQSKGVVVLDPIGSEALVAALPRDHRLARRRSLSLPDLADERFILYRRMVGPGLADQVMEACEAAGFSPVVAQETPQLSSTIALVAAGLGVSIVPEGMAQVRPQAVAYVPITGLALRARLALARRSGEISPAVQNFIAVVKGGEH
ncbi:MAG TPA: LysR family transcriptional regulator [Caulobacteraceae bacterium]|jgi:DNA-binding transcriptional LysR family regulator|nr:LysR family transcriptional regulator [Caulobacteraceae bacterium]